MTRYDVLVCRTAVGIKLWAKSDTSDACYWGSLFPLRGMQSGSTQSTLSSKFAKGYRSFGKYPEDLLIWLARHGDAPDCVIDPFVQKLSYFIERDEADVRSWLPGRNGRPPVLQTPWDDPVEPSVSDGVATSWNW